MSEIAANLFLYAVPPLAFHFDTASKSVRIDRGSGTKMFSFQALYDAIIEAVTAWAKSYSGDLARQLEFIERYDTILSEGRISKLNQKQPDKTGG